MLRAPDFIPGFKPPPYIVRHEDWMRLAWLAATAAVVGAGDVRLTVESRKRLFGLLSGQAVRAERGPGRGAWPAGSLEAALVAHVEKGPEDLQKVYVALIGGRTRNPTADSLQVARTGLIRRGLVETREFKEKVLGLIPTKATAYAATPATEALVAGADVAAVRRLADAGGGIDPTTWTLVVKTFKQAVDWCTIPDQSSSYDPTS